MFYLNAAHYHGAAQHKRALTAMPSKNELLLYGLIRKTSGVKYFKRG